MSFPRTCSKCGQQFEDDTTYRLDHRGPPAPDDVPVLCKKCNDIAKSKNSPWPTYLIAGKLVQMREGKLRLVHA